MKTLSMILLTLFCLELKANPIEKALCGKRLTDPAKRLQRLKKRKRLEKRMPPVENQSPSSWCSAFQPPVF